MATYNWRAAGQGLGAGLSQLGQFMMQQKAQEAAQAREHDYWSKRFGATSGHDVDMFGRRTDHDVDMAGIAQDDRKEMAGINFMHGVAGKGIDHNYWKQRAGINLENQLAAADHGAGLTATRDATLHGYGQDDAAVANEYRQEELDDNFLRSIALGGVQTGNQMIVDNNSSLRQSLARAGGNGGGGSNRPLTIQYEQVYNTLEDAMTDVKNPGTYYEKPVQSAWLDDMIEQTGDQEFGQKFESWYYFLLEQGHTDPSQLERAAIELAKSDKSNGGYAPGLVWPPPYKSVFTGGSVGGTTQPSYGQGTVLLDDPAAQGGHFGR